MKDIPNDQSYGSQKKSQRYLSEDLQPYTNPFLNPVGIDIRLGLDSSRARVSGLIVDPALDLRRRAQRYDIAGYPCGGQHLMRTVMCDRLPNNGAAPRPSGVLSWSTRYNVNHQQSRWRARIVKNASHSAHFAGKMDSVTIIEALGHLDGAILPHFVLPTHALQPRWLHRGPRM